MVDRLGPAGLARMNGDGETMKRLLPLFLLVASYSLGCGENTPNVIEKTYDSGEKRDITPPVIVHQDLEDYVLAGTPVPLSCTATDEEGTVIMARIYYKQETSEEWTEGGMTATGAANEFAGEIPGNFVGNGSSGFHYYLWAVDNSTNEGEYPEGGMNEAIHVRVSSE